MEARERKGKLVQKLIIAAVAAIVGVSIVLVIISSLSINNTYDEMVQEELLLAVEQLNSEMSNVWDGEWEYTDGVLTKGGENVMAEYEEIMDELKASTGVEYSLFRFLRHRILSCRKQSRKVSKTIGDHRLFYAVCP